MAHGPLPLDRGFDELTPGDVKRMIGTAAGLLEYKPATCAGQPRPGVVPFNLKLSVQN